MDMENEKDPFLVALGERIKAERERQGMSRYRLKELVGCSFGEIQAYEEGRKEPKYKRLMAILSALGIEELEVS